MSLDHRRTDLPYASPFPQAQLVAIVGTYWLKRTPIDEVARRIPCLESVVRVCYSNYDWQGCVYKKRRGSGELYPVYRD